MKYILIVLCLFLAGANAKPQGEAKDFMEELLQRLGEIDHKVQEIVKNFTGIVKNTIQDNLKKLDQLRDINYSCAMHEYAKDLHGVISTCKKKAEDGLQNIGKDLKDAIEKMAAQFKAALEKFDKCVKDSTPLNMMGCLSDLMADSDRIKENVEKVVAKQGEAAGELVKCYFQPDVYKTLGETSKNIQKKCGTTGTHK